MLWRKLQKKNKNAKNPTKPNNKQKSKTANMCM